MEDGTRIGRELTIGALIGMAAHLEGKGVGVLDMAGLAQKGGAVQSGVFSTGFETLQAEADGYVRLADVSTSGLVYPFGPFAARQSFLKTHADLASRFMKAYVEGIHRYKTDKSFALATLEKYTRQKSSPANGSEANRTSIRAAPSR